MEDYSWVTAFRSQRHQNSMPFVREFHSCSKITGQPASVQQCIWLHLRMLEQKLQSQLMQEHVWSPGRPSLIVNWCLTVCWSLLRLWLNCLGAAPEALGFVPVTSLGLYWWDAFGFLEGWQIFFCQIYSQKNLLEHDCSMQSVGWIRYPVTILFCLQRTTDASLGIFNLTSSISICKTLRMAQLLHKPPPSWHVVQDMKKHTVHTCVKAVAFSWWDCAEVLPTRNSTHVCANKSCSVWA